ncbi:MAG: hypothetical protein RLZZ422_2882 [Pseudomonadota bacterium]|jgi:hypothetical protein
MLPSALQSFVNTYESLEKGQWQRLATIYANDIIFQDPLHRIEGLPALTRYFESLYTHLNYCRFQVLNTCHQDQQAFVTWTMQYSHPRLNAGREVLVEGVSHLQFQEKIVFHRDYVDLGQMLYEHIPLVGTVIKTIKRRAVR